MIRCRPAGLGVFAVTGPEDAELRFDFFVGNAGVICDATFARHAQLLENLARALEREAVRPAECGRQILDDAPVLARVAWAIDSLVDLDHASLDLGDSAFIFLVQAARQP